MIDKARVQQRFQQAQRSYAEQAIIQQQMAQQLVQLLLQESTATQLARVLEIGCGNGVATQVLASKLQMQQLYLNDFNPADITLPQNITVTPLWGDIEQLDLPSALDLVFSSAVFQWLEQPKWLLQQIKAALQPQGILAFSLFGPQNMQEIKQLTGLGLTYLSLADWQQLLQPEFEILVLTESISKLSFTSPTAVLRHIKATGVNAVNNTYWGKSQYQAFCQAYLQQFSNPDQSGVGLSYHPIYCILRKK